MGNSPVLVIIWQDGISPNEARRRMFGQFLGDRFLLMTEFLWTFLGGAGISSGCAGFSSDGAGITSRGTGTTSGRI